MKYKIMSEPGAKPQPHERATAEILAMLGEVVFMRPANIPNQHTPDIKWLGLEWEIKAPKANSHWAIEQIIHRGLRQSPNLIIDLGRIKGYQGGCIAKIKQEISINHKIRHLKVITKDRRILDMK